MAMGLGSITTAFRNKFPENFHIEWLNLMLWGGSAMLIVDHIANGEALLGTNLAALMADVAITGTAMVSVCVAIWLGMVWVANRKENKAPAL